MRIYKKRGVSLSAAVALITALAMLAFMFVMLSQTKTMSQKEEQELLKKAIQNAVVSCYAIEGRYPESLKKVEKDYGVAIDESKYTVIYEIFADNIMPEIIVAAKGES